MGEAGHSKEEFENMMAQLKTMRQAMIDDDKTRYGTNFRPTSKVILYGIVSLVWSALDRILYRHQYINWEVDENTKHWLSRTGATQFLLELKTCRDLEVVYTPDASNGMRLEKDELHAQLPKMQDLANNMTNHSFKLMTVHQTDEPPSLLHPQFAVCQTKKNRFTI